MAHGIVKLNDGTRDWYLIWSTIVDAPVTRGLSLDELREHIRERAGSDGLADLPARLTRADVTGTSFFDNTLDGLLCCNRAGLNETRATKGDILRRFCYLDEHAAPPSVRAREFAESAHDDQRYGDQPYTVHLDAVAQVLRDLGVTDETLLAAAYLHDVLEDTTETAEDLERADFTPATIALVQAVTNEPCKNRRERSSRTYPKIRAAGAHAVLLKMADRIANIEACRKTKDPRYQMYLQEHAAFAAALYRPGEWPAAWTRLCGRETR